MWVGGGVGGQLTWVLCAYSAVLFSKAKGHSLLELMSLLQLAVRLPPVDQGIQGGELLGLPLCNVDVLT